MQGFVVKCFYHWFLCAKCEFNSEFDGAERVIVYQLILGRVTVSDYQYDWVKL